MNDQPQATLAITTATVQGCVVLRLAGVLDHEGAARLRRAAGRITDLDDPVRVVVDLAGLDGCDAVGAAAVRAMVVTIIEAGGYIVVTSVPPGMRELLGTDPDSRLTTEAAIDLLCSRGAAGQN